MKVLLVFPDKTGKMAEHPISEFITRAYKEEVDRNVAANKKVDRQFPTHTFLFPSSQLVDNVAGARKY